MEYRDLVRGTEYVLLETTAGTLIIAQAALRFGKCILTPVATVAIIPAAITSVVTLNPAPIASSLALASLGPLLLSGGSKLMGALAKQSHSSAKDVWNEIGKEKGEKQKWRELHKHKPAIPINLPTKADEQLEEGWCLIEVDTKNLPTIEITQEDLLNAIMNQRLVDIIDSSKTSPKVNRKPHSRHGSWELMDR